MAVNKASKTSIDDADACFVNASYQSLLVVYVTVDSI